MKKREKNRAHFFLFIYLITLFLAGCDSNPSSSSVAGKDNSSHQPTEAELDAIYATEELMNEWSEERPMFFGGAYRKEEKCIVLLVEDKEKYRNEVLAWSSFDEILSFKNCTFSMNYLQDLYEKMEEISSDRYFRCHISVSDNCVIAKIPKANEEWEHKLLNIDTEGGGLAIQVQVEDPEPNSTDA